jgi:hypothetical protein
MSKALDIADLLAGRLQAAAALQGVDVFVDRQKNLPSKVAGSIGKFSAACIAILYDGFSNPDASRSGRPTVTRRFTVSIFAKPVLSSLGGKFADDVLEAAAETLHNWEPTTTLFSEIRVTGGDYRPDATWLIYDIDLEVISKL